MGTAIPTSIQPLLDAYLQALTSLRTHFYGIYLSGSIALGAFEDLESDIDIIALTQNEWSSIELHQLKTLHEQLLKSYPFGQRLEIFYIPFRYLGTLDTDKKDNVIDPYPTFYDGIFSPAGSGSLNAVTWWIIKHQGIRLLGSERTELPLEVSWTDVLTTMRFNLDVYYAQKIKRPYTYLSDTAVEFAVSNMCRILTTIEEEGIIAKSESLTRWKARLPARWQILLNEAWRIRHHLAQPPLYQHPIQRMHETLAFIHYGRERGHKSLDAILPSP
ncbi:MAG TPA: hypothetical protein VL461_06745 [Dictyobacter sp.]|jgi:hypothetical protein|nr:hypothetical protein [Dictyobacter sp.]